MKVMGDVSYPDQDVLGGNRPLGIEGVTARCPGPRPPLPADRGAELASALDRAQCVNSRKVIIERMDRLRPLAHLSLKVASVMGQWVDLDILHKSYPINRSKEELRTHLQELERGNFLKATDTEGVWEFNMVELDIVYDLIPHYQRRRLHAKLAQELEKCLEEQHVSKPNLATIAYHWSQACMGHELAEAECSLKAIEFYHRAAEAAYTGSSLMEALKLYQKAVEMAEVLAESVDASPTTAQQAKHKGDGDGGPSGMSGRDGTTGSVDDATDATDPSFTAEGSALKGHLNWQLISRLSRTRVHKSISSCCLGIVLQHIHKTDGEKDDYLVLLTEHAIRGLMLLGAPHPRELMEGGSGGGAGVLGRMFFCCFRGGGSGGGGSGGGSAHSGLVLQDSEVQEIRDILLVLVSAADQFYAMQDGSMACRRLLTFCKLVCKFFKKKRSGSGTDPFQDIRSACSSRLRRR